MEFQPSKELAKQFFQSPVFFAAVVILPAELLEWDKIIWESNFFLSSTLACSIVVIKTAIALLELCKKEHAT